MILLLPGDKVICICTGKQVRVTKVIYSDNEPVMVAVEGADGLREASDYAVSR